MEFKKEAYATWVNAQNNISYLFYKTKDDSISVSLKSENYSTELMHSVDGAFSETIYLYEDIVKYAFRPEFNIANVYFLSLGLGLGYIEMLVCAYILKHSLTKSVKIFSFEKNADLRLFFKKFIFNENIPEVFLESYQHTMKFFCSHYNLEEKDLKQSLKKMVENKQLILYEEYNLLTELEAPVNGLFFDAFSINTSPELWTDELINKILNSCDPYAAFATYAARTQLKKLLLSHHFTLDKKPGYGGKKESTFAYRQ